MNFESCKATRLIWASLLTSMAGILSANAASPVPQERVWNSSDSPKIRYFLTDQSDIGWTNGSLSDAVVASPDGRFFFFVSYHGDFDCDCVVYELGLYAVDDVVDALRKAAGTAPPIGRIAVGKPYQAIVDAAWQEDSSGVIYKREDGSGVTQLFRLDAISGKEEQLTKSTTAVGTSKTRGRSAIYETLIPAEPSKNPVGYPIHLPTVPELARMLGGQPPTIGNLLTFATYNGDSPWPLRSQRVAISGPWFSPDGRRAIVIRSPEAAPTTWGRYSGSVNDPNRVRFARGMGLYRQFFGIDLESRREFPLFDAPTGEYVPPDGQLKVAASTPMNAWPTAAEAFWSEDGRQAIVVNTALPLTEAASDERTAMSYIVSYNWDAGSWRVLEPMHQASGISVKTVGWLQPGRELLVTHQRDGERAAGTVYSLRGDSWKARSVGTDVVLTANPERSKRLAKGLLVRVKGDENEPTSIIASQSGRQIVLTPPDPALDGLWWARNRRVEWQDAGGTKHVGGLLLPRKSDRPPPLVIQVGYYITDRFLPDGPFSTGYAAQALVAQGMAVLQFATPMKEAGNYRELEEFRAAWESAVESLSRQGLIDSQRVALTGFSHFGNLTYHAITHPGRIPLAAAVVTDSNTSSYLLYLTYNATGSFDPKSLERLYGGPFWGAKTSWLERETTFNVDRVKTPVLFVGGSSSFTVETIGAFKANRKTFEFLLMPDAPHQLERPRQREASIAATTDWMSFWLMGHEDPSESKADQYVRWRSLRAEHQAKRSPE